MIPTLYELALAASVDRDNAHACHVAPRCGLCGGCQEHCDGPCAPTPADLARTTAEARAARDAHAQRCRAGRCGECARLNRLLTWAAELYQQQAARERLAEARRTPEDPRTRKRRPNGTQPRQTTPQRGPGRHSPAEER